MISPAVTKKPMFWVVSLLFLLSLAAIGVYLFPPLVGKYLKISDEKAALKKQLEKEKVMTANINSLGKDATELKTYSSSASLALPTSVEADLLLLQLEGMTTSMGLDGAKLTVPFGQSVGTSSSVGSGESTPNQPIVKSNASASAQTSFSISGPIDFPALKTLLINLRTLPRWNKVTSIDISKSGDKIATTVTAQVFTSTVSAASYSGTNSKLLEQAKSLFGSVKTYSTTPSATTEGSFGKANPFN